MPSRSTRSKGGHNTQSEGWVRDSTHPHSNNSTELSELERVASIIKPHIITAITTIIEQVCIRVQDNRTHENEIRNVKKKDKKNEKNGVHVMNKIKKKKASKEKKRSKKGKQVEAYPQRNKRECKTRLCYECKSPDHMIKDCGVLMRGKCYECASMNHFRNECPELGRDRKDLERTFKTYQGTSLWNANCNWQEECRLNVCSKCKLSGHITRDFKAPKTKKCYECGSTIHLRDKCPELGRSKRRWRKHQD